MPDPTQTTLALIVDSLPPGFDDMRREADAEGYRFVQRLLDEWITNANRFEQDGEALLAAYVDETLAAIGGITRDPVMDALRMRRFYVRGPFRSQGIGRRLAEALLEHPRIIGRVVVVNAGRGSSSFWEAIGFAPDMRDGHTHILTQGTQQ